MNPFARLVLPQNDTPENRAKRQQMLTEQQAPARDAIQFRLDSLLSFRIKRRSGLVEDENARVLE